MFKKYFPKLYAVYNDTFIVDLGTEKMCNAIGFTNRRVRQSIDGKVAQSYLDPEISVYIMAK